MPERAVLTLPDGRRVLQGEHFDLTEFDQMQRSVVPIVLSVDGQLLGCGSGVCIGPGWFLTAAHVLEEYALAVDRGAGAELFVILETDTRIDQSVELDVFGGGLPVRSISMHPEADLASMTVAMPSAAYAEIRTVDLSLRLPTVGEPVFAAGYPHMYSPTELPGRGPVTVEWERTLNASVGAVLSTQTQRVARTFRGSPGFETDAPLRSGMSGGPVFDMHRKVIGFVSSSIEPAPDEPLWNSFVALLGPALELRVLALPPGLDADPEPAPELTIAGAIHAGLVDCDMHENVDVDPLTGKVIYLEPTAEGDI